MNERRPKPSSPKKSAKRKRVGGVKGMDILPLFPIHNPVYSSLEIMTPKCSLNKTEKGEQILWSTTVSLAEWLRRMT